MLAKLDVKCKAEIRKELLFQHKERERLIEKQLRSREEQAMAASLAGGGRSEVQWMVQCLQVQRHLRRWVSLKHELHQLREQLTATTPGNTTSWPLVSEADEEMREVCEHAGGRPLALMELQEVTALLELRETSLLELADTLKKFTSHKGVVEAEDLAEELKSFRHERMKSLRLELEAMKSAKTAQREDRRHKQENQVKELEADLEEERKVDAEIMDQKRFEQQRKQHLQAVEERMKLQDHLERGELTNPLRENLVEEQSESLGLQQTSLQQETVRIEKEQEARREQKRAWGLRHILEKMAVEEQEDDARYSCQIEHLLTEVTKDFQQAATFSPLRIPLLQAEFSHPGLQEGDQAQHLKSSPMLQHLQEADEKLEANLEPKVLGQSEDHQQEWSPNMARYQVTDQPFIDLLDAQWTCEGELIPVNPERLSLTEFVVYRFGTFIVQLMKRSINAPEVSLLLACSLPRNDYTYNAFRNSFFYQHSERRLFIRRQRLKSLGDFALLLAHCLAHVTADELSDDTNPLFLRLFHQAVKALFNYMFSTRLCLTPASQACELSRRSRDNPYRGNSALKSILTPFPSY
ncbi:trichohyalin-like [Callorhinchus milii]|uniref:trichohyalin-like n=1 Tax=Callorhinchus milii TaxID=7868 RepID=UPI001C3F6572|nr:trichohyalin-like [Callorhinchus milii]